MATQVRAKTKDLYDEDFYVWTEAQAALLRERRFAALDLANLVEEVEALGRAERSKILKNASVVVEHLLKPQHSLAKDPREGWIDSIAQHRGRLEFDLTPRLAQILKDELPRVCRVARRDALHSLRRHGEDAAADVLPEICSYTIEQITGDWWP